MPSILDAESTLAERYQTTVPETVRRALRQFLVFLTHDISTHPERLQSVSSPFVQRVQSLVGEVKVDLDAPLSKDDE